MKIRYVLAFVLGAMLCSNAAFYLLLRHDWRGHWNDVDVRLASMQRSDEEAIRSHVQSLRGELKEEIVRTNADHHAWLKRVVDEFRSVRGVVETGDNPGEKRKTP